MDSKIGQTAALWRERVVRQQRSGVGVRGWCRANGCGEHAFYVWRAKLGLSPARGSTPRGRGGEPIGFARVVVDASPRVMSGRDSAAIVLSLLGGRELALPGSMPIEQIARLVRAIEGAL